MILIDMEIPENCYDCPCSYRIEHGQHEGEEICSIMSYAGKTVEECLLGVGERAGSCPMREMGNAFLRETERIEQGLKSTKRLLGNFVFPFSDDADRVIGEAIRHLDKIIG